ncbi:MAG: hypothetical protein LBB81_05810 [Treponema sp.]|nr:hypothetical protein [Treponema sp.]
MIKNFLFSILAFFLSFHAMAQGIDDLLDIDFDSIFDETFVSGDTALNVPDKPAESPVNVTQRGITFGASYEFQGGFAPGWDLAPWHFDGTEVFSWGQGVKMVSNLRIIAQLSEAFKVYTYLKFGIPGFNLSLGDFFFDYNFFNKVYTRSGKYEHTWGISSFTNLLARIPDAGPSGPAYVIKADIPVGVGGFQALALTRVDIAGGSFPEHWSDIAFGGKYNLALRWADFDMGIFFQRYMMPTRGFFSVKTTLWNTELYNEWLIAVNTHTDYAASYAVNLGFGRDFFDNKITLGGEVFYNGEGTSYFFKPETNFTDAETTRFLNQFNITLNFLYRINSRGSPRIFSSINISTSEMSVQFVPGIRITPLSHMEIYFAVPMALGKRNGYYYTHNADPQNRPFSIMLLVTLTGSVYASYYY